MVSYLELLVIMFILLVFAVILCKKNILSPAVLAMGAYFVMALFALLGLDSWNDVSELSQKTILLITLSAGSFLVGCMAISRIKVTRGRNNVGFDEQTIEMLKCNNFAMNLAMAIILLTYAVLSVINIRGTCAMLGINGLDFAQMISAYNGNTGIFAKEQIIFNRALSFIIPKLLILIDALYCIYVAKITIKKQYKIRIPLIEKVLVIATMLASFLTGSRSHFIKLVLIFFAIHYLISTFYNKRNAKRTSINMIIKTIIIAVAAVCAFYGSISFIGRQTNMNISSYVTFYYGVQVPSLEIYLNKDMTEQEYKARTFDSTKGLQKKLGIIENTEKTSFEFIQYGKYGGSNIYTSVRRPYDDFGILGIIVLMMLFGFVSTYFFRKIQLLNNFSLLIFYHIAIIDTVIDQVRDLSFFARVISSGIVVYWLVCFAVPKICIRMSRYDKS